MSTLAEIEDAADALPIEEQEMLLRHLSQKLSRRSDRPAGWPVPPPAVEKAELQRVHALIEAEFSQVDAGSW